MSLYKKEAHHLYKNEARQHLYKKEACDICFALVAKDDFDIGISRLCLPCLELVYHQIKDGKAKKGSNLLSKK